MYRNARSTGVTGDRYLQESGCNTVTAGCSTALTHRSDAQVLSRNSSLVWYSTPELEVVANCLVTCDPIPYGKHLLVIIFWNSSCLLEPMNGKDPGATVQYVEGGAPETEKLRQKIRGKFIAGERTYVRLNQLS